MIDVEWFEVTHGASLLRGDIFHNCPVIRMATTPNWPLIPCVGLPNDARAFEKEGDVKV